MADAVSIRYFFIRSDSRNSSYINHFLQPDSIIPDQTNPQAFNRYSYVGNNPINASDPSGHQGVLPCWGCNTIWFDYSSTSDFVQGTLDFGAVGACLFLRCNVNLETHQIWGPSGPDLNIIIIPDVIFPVIPINPTSSGDSSWDITLDEFNSGRASYENEVRSIEGQAQKMIQGGYSPQEAAEWAYNQRRQLGVKYKNLTPPDLLEEIYERNTRLYGDPLGPSLDYYLDKGYTPEKIISSAAKPGGEDIIPVLQERIKGKLSWK